MALAMAIVTIPAAAAISDDGRQGTAPPAPRGPVLAMIDAGVPLPPPPPFALTLAFGADALGGAGQCGNPSERAWHHCKLRLAEGGPLATDPPDHAIRAVGVRFELRF